MIFGPELIGKVLSGKKTVTRRRSSRYQVGKVYTVQPGRGKKHVAHIRITSVAEEMLAALTEEEARHEGFPSRAAFVGYWRMLYGRFDATERVTRIAFRLAPYCADCVELEGE
jgi:hypothetical protein